MPESTKIINRKDLKDLFRNGEIPTEYHFHSLIDSTINKHDDGFLKSEDDGIVISASKDAHRFISFFKNIDDLDSFFLVERDDQQPESLTFRSQQNSSEQQIEDEKGDDHTFFFHTTGSLGLGKRSDKRYRLDVKGFAGYEGRSGTYRQGTVPANGQWQTLIGNLDNCQALEVVARTGIKGKGRFALLHAIALSTYGHSRNTIRKTSAHYGFFWNKIRIRWKSNHTHDYALQIKTIRNYGEGVNIYFTIGKLWDDELYLPEEYYY